MIVIDYRDKRPLYEQITEKLAQLIVCGALESNAKLPSVRSLAMELSINPNTIQRAYMQLEQDGYIYTVVGRGNYVTDRSDWQKGFQTAARQELTEARGKAKSSGITLEEVLSMAKGAYAEPDAPPAGAGAIPSAPMVGAGATPSAPMAGTGTGPINDEKKDAAASSKEE